MHVQSHFEANYSINNVGLVHHRHFILLFGLGNGRLKNKNKNGGGGGGL
jgi:hypothetical protein